MNTTRPIAKISANSVRVRRSLSPLLLCVAYLGIITVLFVFTAGQAGAAVVHEYLPAVSAAISKGIPKGCGTGSPACLPGALGGVEVATVDSGHLWLAEQISVGSDAGRTRVDEFASGSGEFLAPQIDEEAGVSLLNFGVALGHAGSEEQVYVGAGKEGQYVLAPFGSTGTLLPGGIWTGKSTPRGSFGEITGVAVSSTLGSTLGDVYVANGWGVDVFAGQANGGEPAEELAQIKLTGATGTGTISNGSNRIEGFSTVTGRFGQRQEVQGPGIPAGAFITAVECPEQSEPCLEMSQPASASGTVSLTGFDEARSVAVSPVTGDVVVGAGSREACRIGVADCAVDVFEPSALPDVYNRLFSIAGAPGEPFKGISGLAVDGEGDIYVLENQARVVDQFNGAGEFAGRISETPDGPFKSLRSLAVDPASGDVFVGEFDEERDLGAVDVFGPARVVPDVATTGGEAWVSAGPDGVGVLEASLAGTVNPLAQGPASCQFVLGTTEALGQSAACDEVVVDGNAPVAVKASVTEHLQPGTRYLFRLQATNKNGTNTGAASDDRELVTPGPSIGEEFAAEVSSTAATLSATIDPNGAPTSYYFQYGKSTAYEAQQPVAPGQGLGDGTSALKAPVHVQGLSPETLYHYRVVVLSRLQVHGGGTQTVAFMGPDRTFTTQGEAARTLPDGRRWELVSPPDKYGAQLEGNATGAVAAAVDGSAISYFATGPTEANVKGTRGNVQALSTRGASGWSSQDLSLPRSTPASAALGPEYRFLSSDLSAALVESPSEAFNSLAPEVFPPDTERGPYVRHSATCAADTGTCYQPLLVGCPPVGQACPTAIAEHADVPAGTKFGGDMGESSPVETVGVSPDLAHLIVKSSVALTETLTGGEPELYEVSPGEPAARELKLVSLVPNEEGVEVPSSGPSLGNEDDDLRHAISQDGRRVVFSSNSHLYLRDLAEERTVQLDAPQAVCVAEGECGEGPSSAQFQFASADGSRVLFTDTQRLTADAGRVTGKVDLYQCEMREVEGRLQCELSDLTPSPGPGQAADVRGAVVGASEDGTWVYFVANGLLGDAAQQGGSVGDCRQQEGQQCNLYVYHGGVTHLVAVPAGSDFHSWAGYTPPQINYLTARVSPDGRYLAFMSQRSLTGYDNRDAVSGEPDQEVFLYHAESAGSGRLVCASCNPSGARPVGVQAGKPGVNVTGFQVWESSISSIIGLAANVPGWTPFAPARSIYQSRYLSDEGRLFFNSHDALVAQDINDNEDVYEFEPAGVGDCSGASTTFHASTGGCVALISSGRASGESAFVDASENGSDVFFLTGERLVGKDVDTSIDLYDAHVCSEASPCAEEVQPPSACVTAESCRAAPAPQPSIFGDPSSATFTGQGNPPASEGAAKSGASTRKKTGTVCRSKRGKHRPGNCKRRGKGGKRASAHRRAHTGSGVHGNGVKGGGR